jgi:hypothetical protein
VPEFEGVENVCGYPGAAEWKSELLKRGVPNTISLPGTLVPVGDKLSFNSLSEQEDLARYARKMEFTDVGFVAPYWQVTRSFMSAVTACKRHYPKLRIYPILGKPLPWDEEATHSQGQKLGIRADFVFSETCRLFAYHEKGDLPSAEEALKYLERL